jgi:nucleotide-binding universal stress UspA family protein
LLERFSMKILISVEDEGYASLQLDFIESHLWPESTSFYVLHVMSVTDKGTAKAGRQQAETLVDKVVKRLAQNVPAAVIIVGIEKGDTALTVLKTAKDWAADLILIESHGKSGKARFVPASVAYDVLEKSQCQTIVIGTSSKTDLPSSLERFSPRKHQAEPGSSAPISRGTVPPLTTPVYKSLDVGS